MALYSGETAETILARILARVADRFDKRTGSIIYDATAPASVELAYFYEALDYILDQAFADTAEREYLIRKAAESGLVPEAARAAVVTGVFTPETLEIPVGARFTCGEYTYSVTEKISAGRYYLTCETAGAEVNGTTGRLIPVETITGLKTAELVEISILGENEEDTEVFRARYFATRRADAFGGNVADYKAKIRAMQGVGGVKIYPAWNGGGTVRCVITNSDHGVPTEALVTEAQMAIDPLVVDGEDSQGQGLGLAPIGHFVTLHGANATTMTVAGTLTFRDGYYYELVRPEIDNVLTAYYTELSKTWQDQENIIIRLAEISMRLLQSVRGILDIQDLRINGNYSNFVVDADSIPVHGAFVATVAG